MTDPIKLESGREWHSKPLLAQKGDILILSARGNDNFYAGLFDRVSYHRKVGADGGGFAFEFGTDTRGFTQKVLARETEDYYIVFRVSVFTFGTTTIYPRLERLRPSLLMR